MSSSSYCALFPQLRPQHSSRYYRLSRVTVGGGGPALRPGADVESPAGDQCGVSFREHQLCVLLVPYAGCPSGGRCRVSFRVPQHGLRPGADVIDLHEIHLARQSSLQVPVGHITVPGGIKLCSPGTFWVANYLIINNGSCQVNFTKPNRAAIRFTNSQWLREDATEAPVGKVAVPKCR